MINIQINISCDEDIAEQLMYYVHQKIDTHTLCEFSGEPEMPFYCEYYEVIE